MDTIVLDQRQINQKLDRIAYQVVEHTHGDSTLLLIGITGNGVPIAKELAEKIKVIRQQEIIAGELTIDKRNPLSQDITTDINMDEYADATIILVDDVINSGKTMQYALLKLLESAPKKVKTVALVDRKHRNFPIRCDFVGLTLSTTLQDRVEVKWGEERHAYLI